MFTSLLNVNWTSPLICASFPTNRFPVLTLASFPTCSNFVCCVCLTLRCPLISSLRQDLSILSSANPSNAPHMFSSLPLFSLFAFPPALCVPLSVKWSVHWVRTLKWFQPTTWRSQLTQSDWGFCLVATTAQKRRALASEVCMLTPIHAKGLIMQEGTINVDAWAAISLSRVEKMQMVHADYTEATQTCDQKMLRRYNLLDICVTRVVSFSLSPRAAPKWTAPAEHSESENITKVVGNSVNRFKLEKHWESAELHQTLPRIMCKFWPVYILTPLSIPELNCMIVGK